MGKKLFWICILLTGVSANVLSQRIIRDVDIALDNNQVDFIYRLPGNMTTGETHQVNLILRSDEYRYYQPVAVKGAVGKEIHLKQENHIVWEPFRDQIDVARKLHPMVITDYQPLGTADNTWLSAALPGLGDYFVANPRDMVFKPYFRTISSLGLIGLGIKAGQERARDKIYETIITGDGPKQHFIGYEDPDPWLFKGDSELFIGLGAAVWIYDIFWVYIRGQENAQLNKLLGNASVSFNSSGMYMRYVFHP